MSGFAIAGCLGLLAAAVAQVVYVYRFLLKPVAPRRLQIVGLCCTIWALILTSLDLQLGMVGAAPVRSLCVGVLLAISVGVQAQSALRRRASDGRAAEATSTPTARTVVERPVQPRRAA